MHLADLAKTRSIIGCAAWPSWQLVYSSALRSALQFQLGARFYLLGCKSTN